MSLFGHQPGWYQDPDGEPLRLRWWNGENWTEDYKRLPSPNGSFDFFGLLPAGAGIAGYFILASVGYFILHTYVYRECLIQPGLAAWPSSCI